jgi:hypothetical protein
MPIQIIITGNDAPEVLAHLASFIGPRMPDMPAPTVEEPRQVPQGNGDGAAVEAEAEAPAQPVKRPRGRPKSKVEPEPEPEAEIEAELADEVADEMLADDIEKDRDRVRVAINKYYVDVYGIEVATPDVLAMYKMRFTDGSVVKVSDIPAGMHDTVIQDVKDMARTNHFKRKRLDQQL